MIFPITDLLSDSESIQWIEQYFHPQGFGCPSCGAGTDQAREFRLSKRGLVDYRCKGCARVYNLYSETIFADSGLPPRKAVLLLRGVCKGESSASLAEELSLSRTTIHYLRQKLQANAYAMLSQMSLPERETETDEMFPQRGGKKVKSTWIHWIRRAAERTSSADMEPMCRVSRHR